MSALQQEPKTAPFSNSVRLGSVSKLVRWRQELQVHPVSVPSQSLPHAPNAGYLGYAGQRPALLTPTGSWRSRLMQSPLL